LPGSHGSADFSVEIADQAGCARYTARIIRDVKIKPSPTDIAKRLMLVEQRPSITPPTPPTTRVGNGQAAHVYDFDLLEGGQILVRRAFSGETLKTSTDRTQAYAEDLVIADAVKPVGLAGVMGGFDTMITAKTGTFLSSPHGLIAAIRKVRGARPAHRCITSLRARRRLRIHGCFV